MERETIFCVGFNSNANPDLSVCLSLEISGSTYSPPSRRLSGLTGGSHASVARASSIRDMSVGALWRAGPSDQWLEKREGKQRGRQGTGA
jgi:hypothetical protein